MTLEQVRLRARGNIRCFLPRQTVSELLFIFAQMKPVNDQTSQISQPQNRSEPVSEQNQSA